MSLNLNLKCNHHDCERRATGGEINGVPFCIAHVDWAMATAFHPVANIEELLRKSGGTAK